MAETAATFETDDLRFVRTHPDALSESFDWIQSLRLNFYRKEFAPRPENEIVHFVNRLTPDSWRDPNAAIGNTATHGQRRMNPQVVAAYDKTDKIVGFAYAAENVSSKLERMMRGFHVPGVIASKIGDKEREKKMQQPERYVYVWGSEIVHNRERAGIVPVLGSLMLEGFDEREPGTVYPLEEQDDLKKTVTSWGYTWDKNDPSRIEGNQGFGIGSPPTSQTRYVIPHIIAARINIQQIPGIADPLNQARQSLAT